MRSPKVAVCAGVNHQTLRLSTLGDVSGLPMSAVKGRWPMLVKAAEKMAGRSHLNSSTVDRGLCLLWAWLPMRTNAP